LELLKNYSWPGNIRELENVVLHAVSLSDDVVYPEHLTARVREAVPVFEAREPVHSASDGNLPTLAEVEEKYVAQVLSHTGGNKQAAARILNIDRKTLTRVMGRSVSKD
jgi:DNA-binding NtrC family response regulator